MNIMKICLVVVLIFWLITEFAPENISAITGMIGIGIAVAAVILFNHQHSERKGENDDVGDAIADDENVEDDQDE